MVANCAFLTCVRLDFYRFEGGIENLENKKY